MLSVLKHSGFSRSFPNLHRPLRRSSNRSCSTLPGTLTGRRFTSHWPESPLPRRISPLRSRRARRAESEVTPRGAFRKGMIWATGWFRSNTNIDSPRFTRSRYRDKFFLNSVIPAFFIVCGHSMLCPYSFLLSRFHTRNQRVGEASLHVRMVAVRMPGEIIFLHAFG